VCTLELLDTIAGGASLFVSLVLATWAGNGLAGTRLTARAAVTAIIVFAVDVTVLTTPRPVRTDAPRISGGRIQAVTRDAAITVLDISVRAINQTVHVAAAPGVSRSSFTTLARRTTVDLDQSVLAVTELASDRLAII